MPEPNLSKEQIGQLQSAFENQPADVIRGQFAETSEGIFAAAYGKKPKGKPKPKPKPKPRARPRPKAKAKSQVV